MHRELLPRFRLIAYDGEAQASSQQNEKNHPGNAFRYQSTYPWASRAPMPQKVWFHFRAKKRLAKIGFSTRKEKHPDHNPKEIRIIGSNECDMDSPEVLLHVKDANFTAMNQARAWVIPESASGAWYQCLGVEVMSIDGNGITALQNMLMWEERVWYSDDPC